MDAIGPPSLPAVVMLPGSLLANNEMARRPVQEHHTTYLFCLLPLHKREHSIGLVNRHRMPRCYPIVGRLQERYAEFCRAARLRMNRQPDRPRIVARDQGRPRAAPLDDAVCPLPAVPQQGGLGSLVRGTGVLHQELGYPAVQREGLIVVPHLLPEERDWLGEFSAQLAPFLVECLTPADVLETEEVQGRCAFFDRHFTKRLGVVSDVFVRHAYKVTEHMPVRAYEYPCAGRVYLFDFLADALEETE